MAIRVVCKLKKYIFGILKIDLIMEPFRINLSQTKESGGRFRRFLVIMAVSLIVVSVISFAALYNKNKTTEWIFILLGVYALIFLYFAFAGYKTKLFFAGTDFAIEYQFSFFKKMPNIIIWETLTKIKLGPTYIIFFKKSGKGKKIHIGWLPYAKVIDIKTNVKSFAEEKGIELEIADFKKN